jgi:hypothetical protein
MLLSAGQSPAILTAVIAPGKAALRRRRLPWHAIPVSIVPPGTGGRSAAMRVGNAMAYVKGLRSWRQRIVFAFARIAARLRVPTPHLIEAGISGYLLTPEGNLLDLRPGLDYLIAHPGHESETHAWIAQHVAGQAGVMLDVGGYIGTFALKHRSKFDLVFVFEPFPANYLACVRNVQLSNAAIR